MAASALRLCLNAPIAATNDVTLRTPRSQQRREAATQRTSGHVIGAVGGGLQPGPLYDAMNLKH